MLIIRMIEKVVIRIVFAEYMIPGPNSMRTLVKSFVARDIRSPVRFAWKNDRGKRSKCSKTSSRRWYSIRRETPIMSQRIRNRNTPCNTVKATISPA